MTAPLIELETRVAAPPEIVFAYFVQPDLYRRWEGSPDLPPGSSTVEVTLIADGDGTIVRLRHEGLPDDASREHHATGWQHHLDRLAIAGSGGDPAADGA